MERTFTRREFTQFMALMLTLFAAVPKTAAEQTKRKGTTRLRNEANGAAIKGVSLAIDFPPEYGLCVRPLGVGGSEEWEEMEIEPDDVSPRMLRQLEAARAARFGTPVIGRVMGDAVIVFLKAHYVPPCEAFPYEERVSDNWRIGFYNDGAWEIAPDNNSWWQHRLEAPQEWAAVEIAFAECWARDNDGRQRGVNYGYGLIQDLMLSTLRHEKPEGFVPWLSNRERKIAATLIQWLGTNCGRSFLHEVERCANGKVSGHKIRLTT